MSRVALLSLALASSLAVACSSASTATKTAADEATPNHEDAREVDQATAESAAEETATASADRRQVGDYVTFTFSGSYRKTPLALTQRVVDKTATTIVVEYVFADKKSKDTLRVTTDLKTHDVVAVARVATDGTAAEVDRAAFETKMAETVAVADENEALVTEEPAKLNVAGSEIDATRAIYKVRIGKKAATLKTLASDSFAWGDLGGEIVTADGKLFYKAELIDAGGSHATAMLER